ncbi:MAG: hypothetical protein RL367_2624 [Pseudomonadota bacterium]|jgi:uncharacterized protein (DUF2062 family)
MANRIILWAKGHLPTRESMASNRWTKPFAKYLMRPSLWRFTRRSVPRAVAIGLLVAPIIPVAHTGVAALLAVPVRANIVIAAATTWLINPFTIPVFYYGAYEVGSMLLTADPVGALGKAGATALGTIVMAVVWSALGYLLSSLAWRLRIAQKWRARRKKMVQ